MRLRRLGGRRYITTDGEWGVLGHRIVGEGPRGGTFMEWEVAPRIPGSDPPEFDLSGDPTFHRTRRAALAELAARRDL